MNVFTVLSMRAKHAEEAALLYEAARETFSSLPPVEILATYKESYRKWYDEHFTDKDEWGMGPDLFMYPFYGEGKPLDFLLQTPTSGRLVRVGMRDGKVIACEVMFPRGSRKAAVQLINAYRRNTMPGDGHRNLVIYFIGDDGKTHFSGENQITATKIEDRDFDFGYDYEIEVSF